MDFNGKTAVITGGSSGIGLALAKELVQRGCFVFLAARRAEWGIENGLGYRWIMPDRRGVRWIAAVEMGGRWSNESVWPIKPSVRAFWMIAAP